jgi:preprotein translocase subunit YajC
MQFLSFIMLQTEGQQGNPFGSLFLFGGLILIMYFFMIRPQMKRAKEAKKFRESLEKGQQVVTIGGIHGKILELNETTALLQVDSGKIRVERSAISSTSTASEQEVGQRAQ